MFGRKRQKRPSRVENIDAARLSLFQMEEGERPIETVVGWMPMGFANNLGMSEGTWFTSLPPDGAMGMSHDEWFSAENSDTRAALWGYGIAIAHVLVLITTRRLVWIPLDADAMTSWSATVPYPVFKSDALGQRSISLADIAFIEAVKMNEVDDLPGGFSVRLFVRLELKPESQLGGPAYPVWEPWNLPGWTTESRELHIMVSSATEFVADLLAVALDHAGVEVRPQQWATNSLNNLPKWRPAYKKMAAN